MLEYDLKDGFSPETVISTFALMNLALKINFLSLDAEELSQDGFRCSS